MATAIIVSRDAALYAEHLALKNSEALSFIPRPKIVQYAERGQVLTALENDEPCGFVIFGNGWPTLKVYQACIQFDARRREHGMALVRSLITEADARQCSDISLWCASDLEANEFWRSAGFEMVGIRSGGVRRARQHNCWRLALPDPAQLSFLQKPLVQLENEVV